MANEIPVMSLKQATLNQGSFSPIIYQPQVEDLNILQRSLAQREAREEKAAEQQTAIDNALGQIEDKLNPTEKEWFTNYKNDIKYQIQEQINAGNYGDAIRVATKLAGNVVSDSKILDRVKAQEIYKNAIDKVKSRTDISKDTKEWWIANHQYRYNDLTDANGNIIGGDYDQFDDAPASAIDLTDLENKAIRFAAPTRTNRAGGKTTDTGGNDWVNNIEELTPEKLKDVMKGVFASTPGAKEYLIQEKQVAEFKLKQYQDLIDDAASDTERKELEDKMQVYAKDLYEDGIRLSQDEYFAKKVNPVLYGAAYKHTTTSSHSSERTGTITTPGKGPVNITDYPYGFLDDIKTFEPGKGGTVNLITGNTAERAESEAAAAADKAKGIIVEER